MEGTREGLMNPGTPRPHLRQEPLVILCHDIFKMGPCPCTLWRDGTDPYQQKWGGLGLWEEPVKQIGFQASHAKQSKFYLLPQEPEILTAKRDLW